MKELKEVIRMYIAETFLGWAAGIAPRNEDGKQLIVILYYYFQSKVKQRTAEALLKNEDSSGT